MSNFSDTEWVFSSFKSLRESPQWFVAGVTAFALLAWSAAKPKAHARPPGPPGGWILGNAFDIPTVREWLVWNKWKEQYGPIVSLKILGQLIIGLNTPDLVDQVLEKKSSITSDRTRIILVGEMVGYEHTLVGLQHDFKHKEARKLLNQTIGKVYVSRYNALVEDETLKLVTSLMDAKGKEEIISNIRHSIGSIILAITYGFKAKEKDDPNIRDAELALVPFNVGTQPGAFLVDSIPILRYVPGWFPGASWKRLAQTWAEDLRRSMDNPIKVVKTDLERGIRKESVAHSLLSDPSVDKAREERISWACGSMYLGGSDTTVSAIHTFLLTMILNPAAQKKGQEEIDNVIGNSRLPNLNDRASLPYVGAIMNESLRWHPVAPLCPPHVLKEEQVVEGYVFPKGTILVGNIWGIMRDEKYFSRPSEFLPERFLQSGKDSNLKALLDPQDYVFGFGRRVCPGRDLALTELWLFIAITLATLDISKALDSQGNEIEPTVDFTSGIISHPVPFECKIQPRNSRTEAMAREAVSRLA